MLEFLWNSVGITLIMNMKGINVLSRFWGNGRERKTKFRSLEVEEALKIALKNELASCT
jgi:hypothetical protein